MRFGKFMGVINMRFGKFMGVIYMRFGKCMRTIWGSYGVIYMRFGKCMGFLWGVIGGHLYRLKHLNPDSISTKRVRIKMFQCV